MSEQSSNEYHVPQWTIHDRLRKAREDAGFTQADLAALIEVSENTIGNCETGATKNPRRIVVGRWAWATKVPVEWLRDGVVPPTSPDGDSTQAGETPICSDSSARRSARVVPLRSASPLAA
mgnify:CR=1 FL=1